MLFIFLLEQSLPFSIPNNIFVHLAAGLKIKGVTKVAFYSPASLPLQVLSKPMSRPNCSMKHSVFPKQIITNAST